VFSTLTTKIDALRGRPAESDSAASSAPAPATRAHASPLPMAFPTRAAAPSSPAPTAPSARTTASPLAIPSLASLFASAGAPAHADEAAFVSRLKEALAKLKSNTPSMAAFADAARLLIVYLQNTVKHPLESKYRRIRAGNSVLKKKLLAYEGGGECLVALGFELVPVEIDGSGEKEPFYVMTHPHPSLPRVLYFLEDALTRAGLATPTAASSSSTRATPAPAAATSSAAITPTQISTSAEQPATSGRSNAPASASTPTPTSTSTSTSNSTSTSTSTSSSEAAVGEAAPTENLPPAIQEILRNPELMQQMMGIYRRMGNRAGQSDAPPSEEEELQAALEMSKGNPKKDEEESKKDK